MLPNWICCHCTPEDIIPGKHEFAACNTSAGETKTDSINRCYIAENRCASPLACALSACLFVQRIAARIVVARSFVRCGHRRLVRRVVASLSAFSESYALRIANACQHTKKQPARFASREFVRFCQAYRVCSARKYHCCLLLMHAATDAASQRCTL